MTMTAGYQYRTIIEQLGNPDFKGKSPDSLLYFSQLLRLGEVLFHKGRQRRNSHKGSNWMPLENLRSTGRLR